MKEIMREDLFSEFIHNNMVVNKTIYSNVPYHYLAMIFIKAVHNFHLYKYQNGNKEYFLKLLNFDFFLSEFEKLDENKDEIVIEQLLISFDACGLRVFKECNFNQIKNKEYGESAYLVTSELWCSKSIQFDDILR